MPSTPISSVLMFIFAAIFGAVGQFLYKAGADSATGGLVGYLANPRIIGGVICYTAVMVLFVAAFKRGGSLAVLYPIYASTFIWAALIARLAYGNPIHWIHVLGWLMLIIGMACMGWTPRTTETVFVDTPSAQLHAAANHMTDT